ncbi:hypothetical protein [Dehalobacter sp.]|uniref:rolling circle replication-associated protein n=1 Tax=Dehalobacter sp. TaxID=1962289 RepID=UPI0025868E00|nr:hypothetical protein [Dehalobacter sp.]MDJ0304545.1 hypothetical protein [Dehalobacter sp.]
MRETMLLECSTVHEYDFGKFKEYVIYDDVDYWNSEGVYKRSSGRVGKKADEVTKRDRGIAISRAKKTLRRIALHNKMSRLMTLTTQENISDFEKLDKLFKKFVFNLRSKYPDFKYIGTRERQSRGAVHYHILYNRFIPWKEAIAIWQELIKGKGTVNLEKIDGLKAINYVLEYVGKSMKNPFVTKKGFNAKSYLCSTNLDRNYKMSRSVKKFYVQMVQEYHALQNYLKNLEKQIKDKATKVIFDKVFQFDYQGDIKFGRSILIQTG